MRSKLLGLPLVFINLAGEMIYILCQRLIAQQVESSKSKQGFSNSNFVKF